MLHAVPVEFQRPAPGTWYGGFGDIPRHGAVSRAPLQPTTHEGHPAQQDRYREGGECQPLRTRLEATS